MSQAEIFQIIDVLATPRDARGAVDVADAPRDGGDALDVRRGREHLALWSNPANTDTLVATRPAQVIALEHILPRDPLDERLVMLREPESARARSYRLLRHRLLSKGDPRIVVFTSARPGEGKTTSALNLSLAIAEDTMMRVLLLETNLRRPALGALFGFEPKESLVENVTRFMDVGPPYPVAALAGTRLHVSVLPAVSLPDARLDRTLFALTLADLRTAYDYIVIDAASVLESADSDVVAECSDGIVLTARAGSSRRADGRRAIAQLAPANVLGTILLDV